MDDMIGTNCALERQRLDKIIEEDYSARSWDQDRRYMIYPSTDARFEKLGNVSLN